MKKISFMVLIMFLMFYITFAGNVSAAGFGFVRNDENKTPSIGKYATILEGTSSYYVGDTQTKKVYLTFDAGYDNGEMDKILDILHEKNVTASFFITGDFVERFPLLTMRLAYEGHAVCNHTYSHRDITTLSYDELEDDLSKLEENYFELTNQQMEKYVRPPAGTFDKNSLVNLQKLGYKTIFWSSAYQDWNPSSQKGKDEVLKIYIDNLHPGAIILMHSVSTSNREALSDFIDETIKLGYTFDLVTSI